MSSPTVTPGLPRPARPYRVPGVYAARRPRPPEAPPLRTDVAGFVGFEPRLRDATPPSSLTPSTAPGAGPKDRAHAFAVTVAGFRVALSEATGLMVAVPAAPRFVLSESDTTTLIEDHEGITFAVAVMVRAGAGLLVSATGTPGDAGHEVPPEDADVLAAVVAAAPPPSPKPGFPPKPPPWVRLADVVVRRSGGDVTLTIVPALRLTRCDDWDDFVLSFGQPADDGAVLARAVHAYFTNGGNRCYVSTVRRPAFTDDDGLAAALEEMIGEQGDPQARATGLERLLLEDEVSFIDVPDLYARRPDADQRTVQLPPPDKDACFIPCPDLLASPAVTEFKGAGQAGEPLYAWDPNSNTAPPSTRSGG